MRRPKTKDQTEHHIKKQVKQILDDTGWKFWMPSAGIYGRSGVSDFLAVKRPKKFMAIETKYDDVPTQLQLKFLTDIYEAGHYAFLVDETNVEHLRKFLMLTSNTSPQLILFKSLMKWQENLTAKPIS